MTSLLTRFHIRQSPRQLAVCVSLIATSLLLLAAGAWPKTVSASPFQDGPMTASFNVAEGTMRIFRNGQLVVVYQRDAKPGTRSIGNTITELYVPGHPEDNLVADTSPIVPPQLLVKVGAGNCQNNLPSESCDYFAHHNPQVNILQASGSAVVFSVTAQASQHDDQGTPLNFTAVTTLTVPYHPQHTVIEYATHATLGSRTDVDFALRPLPFYELVQQPYTKVAYLNTACRIATDDVPTQGPEFFVYLNTPVCQTRPWAALYANEKGNLGLILKSLKWPSGDPRLVSFTETQAHPQRPNLYFQSSDAPRVYEEGVWDSQVVFIAYANAADYLPVHLFKECFPETGADLTATVKVKAKPRRPQQDVLSPTAIEVQAGDTLCFTATKRWDMGEGSVGPDGTPALCECPVSDAHGNALVGALIGRIGSEGAPFLIGSANAVRADRSGTLYLGSNDNLGPCNGQRGSCYNDNSGKLKVFVRVKHSTVVLADPQIMIAAPDRDTTGLTVTFRWHMRNAPPGEVYRYKVRMDKGSDACDSGIEEEFDAGTASCLQVTLSANRYSNQNTGFAIQATDSQGRVFCTRGQRLSIDPQLPAAAACGDDHQVARQAKLSARLRATKQTGRRRIKGDDAAGHLDHFLTQRGGRDHFDARAEAQGVLDGHLFHVKTQADF